MGKLVLLESGGKARDIMLDRQRITIGRRADNDVCLPYPAVSSEHAAVVTILSDSFLEDLESTNGTLVNGRPITKVLLHDGDRIDIGLQELIYLVDDTAILAFPVQQADGARPPTPTSAPEPARSGAAGVVASLIEGGSKSPTEMLPHPRTTRATEPARSTEPGGGFGAMRADAMPELDTGTRQSTEPGATSGASGETFALRVLGGAGSERLVPLVNDETVIGRAGLQVVAIRREAGAFRVVPLEGSVRPTLNGHPVQANGDMLGQGDVLEIAGTKLTMVALPAAST